MRCVCCSAWGWLHRREQKWLRDLLLLVAAGLIVSALTGHSPL